MTITAARPRTDRQHQYQSGNGIKYKTAPSETTAEINFAELHRQLDWIRGDLKFMREIHQHAPTPQDYVRLVDTGIHWNQCVWFESPNAERDPETGRLEVCGSYACLAGHTAIEAGAVPIPGVDERMMWEGEVHYTAHIAARVLGIELDRADMLFAPGNTLDDLEWMVAQWEMGKDCF